MSSKTPVSILQEYVVRFNVGSMPKYDLVQVAGPCHDPTFCVRVLVGGRCATGCGKTKREAKHAAAKAMFDDLTGSSRPSNSPQMPNSAGRNPKENLRNSSGSPRFVPEPRKESADPDSDEISCNPIGELQELCVSRYGPFPAYQIQSEEGPPHKKLFVVSCRVANIEETGTGRSKRLAKRAAAFKMLARIKPQANVDNDTRPPNGPSTEQFPSPERAKDKHDQGRLKPDQVVDRKSYRLEPEKPHQLVTRQAYHTVRDAVSNLHLNATKGAAYARLGSFKKTTAASDASGAATAQPEREKSWHSFFRKSGTGVSSGLREPETVAGRSCIPSPSSVCRGPSDEDYKYTDGSSFGRVDFRKSGLCEGGADNAMAMAGTTSGLEVKCRNAPSSARGTPPSVSKSVPNASRGLGMGKSSGNPDFTELNSSSVQSSFRVTVDVDAYPRNGNPTFELELSGRIRISHLKPSQRTPENCQSKWLYCLSESYDDCIIHPPKVGKWMIFAKNSHVDEVWYKLKKAIERGLIWQAKVSWNDPEQNSHAIMVYTVDYEDVDDVIRVLDVLEDVGAKLKTSEIYYKPNYMTWSGIYRGGKNRPWIYRSSDIRARARSGNFAY